jgi:hypothetical protein
MSATNNPTLIIGFRSFTVSVQLYGPSLISLIPYFLHFKPHLQTLFFQIHFNNILPHTHSSESGLLLVNKCNIHVSSLWYCAHSCTHDTNIWFPYKLGYFLSRWVTVRLWWRTLFHGTSMFHRGPHPEPDEFQSDFINYPGVIFQCEQTEYLLSSKIF